MRLIGRSCTHAAAELPSRPAAEQLPDDPAVLKRMIVELLATLHQERRDHEAVRHRLDLLLRRLYGPRGERFDPNQPLLFAELAEGQDPAAAAAASTPKEKSKRRGKPHGRRRLPDNLPRQPKHHELPAADRVCPGCGQLRIDIGVDKSEQLDYRPASLFVIEHVVHKYACPCCSKPQGPAPAPSLPQHPETDATHGWAAELGAAATPLEKRPAPEPMETTAVPPPPGPSSADPLAEAQPPAEPPPPPAPPCGVVVAAPKPALPIAKGLPGPGLLAHLIVSKCVDHLPLNRLERVYERQGLVLPRSTTCDWLAACAHWLRPLYELMVEVVLASRAVHTDDTPVKMQDRLRQLVTARLWVYLGDAAHAYNVFDFTPNRKRDGPQRFLADYRGYLQADAFSGYDGLYLPDPRDGVARILEVACNAHARRKFYDARSSDELRAHQALAYYAQLYEIERQAKNFDEGIRLHMRQDLAVPILNQFRTWLDGQRAEVLPKSPLGEAFTYVRNNWTALVRYTEASFLAIDNNVAEREMKTIALGRKNWLFVGSEQGGQTAAVLYSFTSTCQRLRVEPWAYLQDVLTRLPTTAPAHLADLLPDRWEAARRAQAATSAAPPGTNPSAESAS
jgi:transposase